MQQETHSALVERFENFARSCAIQDSPFYQRLAQYVATAPQLLAIAAHGVDEAPANAFFAAVHYLLLKGSTHQLGQYYASITVPPPTDDGLYQLFADFCSNHRGELIALVQSRLVQTNEINRSAILAPAFSLVYAREDHQPLALLEIGASAGLNLLWDRYCLRYSDGTTLGDPDGSVRVECDSRGAALSAGAAAKPLIAWRLGIDLCPVDLHDADERLWLRALVWPDHGQRAQRLQAAMALARRSPPEVVRGDALRVLPGMLANVPHDCTLCVYQSSVLYQFSRDQRERLSSILAMASIARPLFHVSAESEQGLWLLEYRDGRQIEQRRLAEFDTHGRWLRWQA